MDETRDFLLDALEYDDALMHHGIKGQKWGVRRFQNPDGTLTELGKKRKKKLRDMTDDELRAAIKRANLERRYAQVKNRPSKARQLLKVGSAAAKTTGNVIGFAGQMSGEKTQKSAKAYAENVSKIGSATADIVGRASSKKKKYKLSSFSDEELEKIVQRAELEKTYMEAVKGRNFNDSIQNVSSVLANVGSVLSIATATIALKQMLEKEAK